MAVLALALRAVLVGVFAVSGFAKLFGLDRSRHAARALGVPEFLAPTVGIAVPVVELLVAALLIAQPSPRIGAAIAVVLLAAFSVVIGANLARDHRPECNCFGVLSNTPIGWPTLVRNLVLLLAAATTWVVGDASDWAEVFEGGAWIQNIEIPPLTAIVSPVMNDASSEARKAIAAATSSGAPERPMAVASIIICFMRAPIAP